jgi:hypothetical protein
MTGYTRGMRRLGRCFPDHLQEGSPVRLEQLVNDLLVDVRRDDLPNFCAHVGEDPYTLHLLCLGLVILGRSEVVSSESGPLAEVPSRQGKYPLTHPSQRNRLARRIGTEGRNLLALLEQLAQRRIELLGCPSRNGVVAEIVPCCSATSRGEHRRATPAKRGLANHCSAAATCWSNVLILFPLIEG